MFQADKTLGTHRWPVVRLKAGSRTEAVLLSERFFQLTTHWHRVTFPCCGEDCPVCQLMPARGLFYLAVGCNGQVSILELAAQSANNLEQHAKMLGEGMKVGSVFELTRRTDKAPVRAEFSRHQERCNSVSDIELAKRVMSLYKFPPPNPTDSMESYEMRCRHIAKIRCDGAATLMLAKDR